MNHIFRHASLPWCICAGLALGTKFFALPLRAGVPDRATIADAFTLNSKDRTEGASLNGIMTEKGNVGWVTQKSVIFKKDGAVTTGSSEGGVAYVALPDGAGNVVKVEADINASGTDWVGLALGQGLNDFYNGAQLFILLRPNGEYVVFAQGLKTQIGAGSDAPQGNDANHVELEYHGADNTVTASINGQAIITNHALGGFTPVLKSAGFYFNPPPETKDLKPGISKVDNFAVTVKEDGRSLAPSNVGQCFIEPDRPVVLTWIGASAHSWAIIDYTGREVSRGEAAPDVGEPLKVPVRLPRGYYEIVFDGTGPTFGIVAAPQWKGATDPFFCIDSALSWLEPRAEVREALIGILHRSGIGMSRERLSWDKVNPAEGQWDWETANRFDSLRQSYVRQGVPVLEMFHYAPAWTGTSAPDVFPANLRATAQAWSAIAKHWLTAWGGIEIWNEPDIAVGSALPADRYLPLVKILNYALRPALGNKPQVGGVFSYFNPTYLEQSIANGLLESVDSVSFHEYGKSEVLERTIASYRAAMTGRGREGMPLWITECGWPWRMGPGRPPAGEDAESALQIAMKAVEARAGGIARFFPFVYPSYEESGKNFGMMGKEATPLRSMAAYVQAVSALGNFHYAGDLPITPPLVRARVFAMGDQCVVVLYTGQRGFTDRITLSFAPEAAAGLDGRGLAVTKAGIPIPDGLVYLKVKKAAIAPILITGTVSARLLAAAEVKLPARPAPSAIVLRYPLTPAIALSNTGYRIPRLLAEHCPVTLQASNLSAGEKLVTLRAEVGETHQEREITIPPSGTVPIDWVFNLEPALPERGIRPHSIHRAGKKRLGTGADDALFFHRPRDRRISAPPSTAHSDRRLRPRVLDQKDCRRGRDADRVRRDEPPPRFPLRGRRPVGLSRVRPPSRDRLEQGQRPGHPSQVPQPRHRAAHASGKGGRNLLHLLWDYSRRWAVAYLADFPGGFLQLARQSARSQRPPRRGPGLQDLHRIEFRSSR